MVDDLEDIGREAAANARKKILTAFHSRGITADYTAMRLKQSMDAKEVKVFKDSKDKIVYSKPLVSHNIRLQATKFAVEILDALPNQKVDLGLPFSMADAVAAYKQIQNEQSGD